MNTEQMKEVTKKHALTSSLQLLSTKNSKGVFKSSVSRVFAETEKVLLVAFCNFWRVLTHEYCVKNGRPETGRKATAHGADSARGTLPNAASFRLCHLLLRGDAAAIRLCHRLLRGDNLSV